MGIIKKPVENLQVFLCINVIILIINKIRVVRHGKPRS